jgi:type III secretion system YscJ/HrcJ family lipoprotein
MKYIGKLIAKMKKWGQIVLLSCVLFACSQEETLLTGLTQKDAVEMRAILIQNGIQATSIAGAENTYNLVLKDNTNFVQAVNLLKNLGYPRKEHKSICDIFTGDSMVSTPLELKMRTTCALNESIASSIVNIQGILDTHVHIVLPETDPITRLKSKASASVIIIHRENMDTTTLIPKIRSIVSNSVNDLDYENVSVSLFANEFFNETKQPVSAKTLFEKQSPVLSDYGLDNHNTESFSNSSNTNSNENSDTSTTAESSHKENTVPKLENNNKVNQNFIIIFICLLVIIMLIFGFFIIKISQNNTKTPLKNILLPHNK